MAAALTCLCLWTSVLCSEARTHELPRRPVGEVWTERRRPGAPLHLSACHIASGVCYLCFLSSVNCLRKREQTGNPGWQPLHICPDPSTSVQTWRRLWPCSTGSAHTRTPAAGSSAGARPGRCWRPAEETRPSGSGDERVRKTRG